MARAIWSGSISFGLVSIPVKLYGALEPRELHFHLLHDADGGRIHEKRVCSVDGKEVPWEHVVKGYDVAKGSTVQLERGELDRFAPEITHSIDIEQFVDLDEIDPIYFDTPYHVVADAAGRKAYGLLAATMKSREKVAIARVVLRTRQKLCAIRGVDGALVLSTMHYPDELRASEVTTKAPKPAPRELALAEQLVSALEAPWTPSAFKDEYRDKVLAYLKKKGKGKAPALVEKDAPAHDVRSLVDALSASLAKGKTRTVPRKRRAPKAATRRRAT